MAKSLLRPNADIALGGWTVTDGGATEAWQVLDEDVEQPTAPSVAGDFISDPLGAGANASVELTSVGAKDASQAILWVYGELGASTLDVATITATLRKADDTVLATVAFAELDAAQWKSATHNGALTQADVNGLKIVFASAGMMDANEQRRAYAAYVELTYVPRSQMTTLGVG